ncbi:trypsin-like serine protease [Asticcacaulis sp.]|uniref:trypsin-like serine peptidase n=1 Tax=Asticcacaulis sp. TaxID=1872648 RepID=UPI00261BC688|nr:trypsin-like serine protease [Asticcacaulis sp.]
MRMFFILFSLFLMCIPKNTEAQQADSVISSSQYVDSISKYKYDLGIEYQNNKYILDYLKSNNVNISYNDILIKTEQMNINDLENLTEEKFRDLIIKKRRKIEEIMKPSGPLTTINELNKLIKDGSVHCKLDNILSKSKCSETIYYAGIITRIDISSDISKNCELASARFRNFYDGTDKIDVEHAIEYDLACLGSFVDRKNDIFSTLDAVPTIISDSEQVSQILDVVGLLKLDGAVICSGLIRNDRTFLTAKHCIKQNRNANYTLSSASGLISDVPLTFMRAGDWGDTGVPIDWAVYKMPPGESLNISRINLVKYNKKQDPSEVTIVAPYAYYNLTDYNKEEKVPKVILRYPRKGLCQALAVSNGCLQLACQTVRGFSGAPVFSTRLSDGSYNVVGLISSSDGEDARCSSSLPISNSTFAVSAEILDKP